MTENKSRIYSVLQAFLPILVLLGHVSVMYTPDGAISLLKGSVFLEKLARYIYSFHMPLFFSLSGALWAYQVARGKYENKPAFIKNKAKRLLIPYLFFGVCVVAPVMLALGLTQQGFFTYVIRGILLSENSRHLWYVLALFLVFILAAFIRPLWKKAHPALILIPSLLVLIASQYLPRSVFQIQAALYYQFFFFLGSYLDRYLEKLIFLVKKAPYLPFIALLAVLLRFTLPYNTVTLLFYNFCGIFAFYGFAALIASEKLVSNRFVKTLARDGFGLYLFHPMIVYCIMYLGSKTPISPFLLFPLTVLVSFTLSMALTELVRKIKLGILIGE